MLDFNRLRRPGCDDAVSIAAGIFLDVLNIIPVLWGAARAREGLTLAGAQISAVTAVRGEIGRIRRAYAP